MLPFGFSLLMPNSGNTAVAQLVPVMEVGIVSGVGPEGVCGMHNCLGGCSCGSPPRQGRRAPVAFLMGWLVSVAMMSAALSMIETVGLSGDSVLRIHIPPLWVSLALGSAFALSGGDPVGALSFGGGGAEGSCRGARR
jgi:hypothetical protein